MAQISYLEVVFLSVDNMKTFIPRYLCILGLLFFWSTQSVASDNNDCDILSKRADVDYFGWVPELITSLSRAYDVPICAELDEIHCAHPKYGIGKCDSNHYGAIRGRNVSLLDALDMLTRVIAPSYSWEIWNCKIINVFPWRQRENPDYIMNHIVTDFNVKDKNADETFEILNRVVRNRGLWIKGGWPLLRILSGFDQKKLENMSLELEHLMKKRISIHVRKDKLRYILNTIASKLGKYVLWRSESRFLLDEDPNCICGNRKLSYKMGYVYLVYNLSGNYSEMIPEYTPLFDTRNKIYEDQKRCNISSPHRKKQLIIDNQPIEHAILMLGNVFSVPIHYESILKRQSRGSTEYHDVRKLSADGYMSLGQALDEITSQDNRYTWYTSKCRAVNVIPRFDANYPQYLMNLPIEGFDVSEENIADAIWSLARILRRRYRVLELREPDRPEQKYELFAGGWPGQPISIHFDGVTVRDVLNTLFETLPSGLSWQYHRWIVVPEADDRERGWCGMEAHSEIIPVLPQEE